jgi:hypothetical protein
MKLKYMPITRQLMQAVDVLRDDSPKNSTSLPSGQRPVTGICGGVGKLVMRFAFLPPVLASCCLAR